MNIVTIKEVKGVVTCADDGTAEHTFNVKNATDKALKVGMQLAMDGPTSADWLAIEGSTDHELDVETMTQVSVKIQVPPDCAPGKYSYRLRVYDPANPGEIFTDGDPVYFEVPEKKVVVQPEKEKETQKFKWWIPVAIAVGVIAIGLAVWGLWPASEIEVPQLKGLNLSAALQQVSKSGLTFNDEKDLIIQKVSQSDQHAKILNQRPQAGEKVAPETSVKLWLGQFVKKGGKKGKFVIKDLSRVQKMKGIKMSSGFVKREVAPAPE